MMILAFASSLAFAQEYSKEKLKEMDNYLFQETFKSASPKKTSTVVLKDGKVLKGYSRGFDKKKGQIYSVNLKDSITGNTQEIEATQIAELYLYAMGLEKFGKMNKFLSNSRNWSSKSMNKNFKNDQIPFFNEKVSLKNKEAEKEYLMQLINPDFSSKIKVYADPVAKETTTFAVGGIGVTGGVTKSFYVKKDGKVFWLEKSNFEESYSKLFGDNPAFMKEYPVSKMKWDFLSWLIYEYTRMSEEK